MPLHVPNRDREPEPWARVWVEESAKKVEPLLPVPWLAQFALGLTLGLAILVPCASMILKVI